MIAHFKNIEYLYRKASVQLPNGIFKELSTAIRSSTDTTNANQVSFAYAYLVATAFLYKYAQFVDTDHGTYIQNSNLKELLGYGKSTKSIDRILKKDGVLDELGLTATTREYPVRFYIDPSEEIGGFPSWNFVMRNELLEDDILLPRYKEIVKNRNYEIKEPLFLTTGYKDNDYGTLYSLERTHEITIHEFLTFFEGDAFNNIDFLAYSYLKARCKGYRYQTKALSLTRICGELGMEASTFLLHLKKLEERKFIIVKHGKWRMPQKDRFIRMESNEYRWKGVS